MANRALQQFDPDFQTPLIFDESVDFSDPEESRFAGAFSDGLLAKSDPTLSMSGFQKSGLGGEWKIVDPTPSPSLHGTRR